MIAAKVTAEFEETIAFLLFKQGEWRDRLLLAMRLGAADEEADIRGFQWGGRKPDDTGLNRRTSNLYYSLESAAERIGAGVRAMVQNRGASYWWYHDAAGPGGKMPVRTNIHARFEDVGLDLYASRIDEGLREVFG